MKEKGATPTRREVCGLRRGRAHLRGRFHGHTLPTSISSDRDPLHVAGCLTFAVTPWCPVSTLTQAQATPLFSPTVGVPELWVLYAHLSFLPCKLPARQLVPWHLFLCILALRAPLSTSVRPCPPGNTVCLCAPLSFSRQHCEPLCTPAMGVPGCIQDAPVSSLEPPHH